MFSLQTAITYFAVSVCQNLPVWVANDSEPHSLFLSLSSAVGISFLYWANVVFKKDGFKNFAYFCVFNMEWGKGLPEASGTGSWPGHS